ncbi:MAG: hypothetical protein WCL71_16215 [Deltaproteobacteria bacterium]
MSFGSYSIKVRPLTITRKRIFISSVQKEFAQVRRDQKAFLLGDA